jgi:YbbR domain-containing protein
LLDQTFTPAAIFRDTKVLANEEETPLTDLNIFPNPAQIETTIQSEAFAKNNAEFSVTDVYGRTFNTNPTKISRTEVRLNVSNLSEGKYFVKVDTGAEPIVKALMVVR